jgi:hypothetical protein
VIGDYESIAMSEHLSLLLRIGLPIKPMEHIVVEEMIAQGGERYLGRHSERVLVTRENQQGVLPDGVRSVGVVVTYITPSVNDIVLHSGTMGHSVEIIEA